MPKWKVHVSKIPAQAALHTEHGGVWDNAQSFEIVEADDANIDIDGSLVFINEKLIVRAFAPGFWQDAKLLEDGDEG